MAQLPRLSNREWEIIKHLLQGKSNKLMASSLGITQRTVEFYEVDRKQRSVMILAIGVKERNRLLIGREEFGK